MRTAFAVIALSLSLLAASAQAEQKQRFDQFEVHYIIVNSTFLEPQVASAYGITRGDDRFILNIAVREVLADGSSVARKADIKGTRFDLIHRNPLDFKEIDERTAIYYIAQFQARNREKLDFTLQIQPETSPRAYKLQFNQMLHTGR